MPPTQVADGVWVRQSEWVWTNSIVLRTEDGLILVDPGIHGSELNELADDLEQLGVPVVAPPSPTCVAAATRSSIAPTRAGPRSSARPSERW